jgi:hypothetical protein
MKLNFIVLNASLAAFIFHSWIFAQVGIIGWGIMLLAVCGLYWGTVQRYRDLKQQYPLEAFKVFEEYNAKHFGTGKKGEEKHD